MAVTIPFVADLSDVRAALDRLIADARAKSINIGGGLSGSFAAGLGGGAPPPTVQGIFGGSLGGVGGSFGAGIGMPFGGGGGPLANGGFFSAGPTATSIFGYPGSAMTAAGSGAMAISSPQGSTIVVPPAGGGGGNAGGSFSNSFAGRGFGRIVGAGFLFRAGEATVGAERQYAIDSTLAGSDQRAQLKSTMTLREKLQGAVPIVGNLLGDINDITGSGQIGVEATVRSADAQEARLGIARQTSRNTQQLRFETAAAGIDSTFERADLAAANEHRQRRDRIDDASKAAAAADEKQFAADDAIAASSRSQRIVNRFASKTPGNLLRDPDQATIDEVDAEDRAASADARHKVTVKREGGFAGQYALEDKRFAAEGEQRQREKNRSNTLESASVAASTRATVGATEVYKAITGHEPSDAVARIQLENSLNQKQDEANQARLKASLDPNVSFSNYIATARRADAVGAENEATRDAFEQGIRDRKYNEGNQAADRISALDVENQVLNSALKNDPLNSRLQGIEGRRRAALQDIDPLADADEFHRTNEKFDKIRDLERKDYDFDKTQSLHASEATGRVLDARLGGGRFADVDADAVAIKERAFLKVESLSRDPEGNRSEISQTLQNAQKEEELTARNFLQRFKPQEIDINRTSLSGEGNSEILDTLKSINDAAQAIKDSSENWGKAGP